MNGILGGAENQISGSCGVFLSGKQLSLVELGHALLQVGHDMRQVSEQQVPG